MQFISFLHKNRGNIYYELQFAVELSPPRVILCVAVVLLEIAVESLSMERDDDDDDASGMSYVRAVCDFRHLVLSDYQQCLTKVRRTLAELYGCSSVQPLSGDDEAGAVLLELRQPRSRVVALQCDHTSGHLARELQRVIVTPSTRAALRVAELNITTDLRTVKTAP